MHSCLARPCESWLQEQILTRAYILTVPVALQRAWWLWAQTCLYRYRLKGSDLLVLDGYDGAWVTDSGFSAGSWSLETENYHAVLTASGWICGTDPDSTTDTISCKNINDYKVLDISIAHNPRCVGDPDSGLLLARCMGGDGRS